MIKQQADITCTALDSHSFLCFIPVKHLLCLCNTESVSEQKLGHIFTVSCNILYLAVTEPCYWCKELLGFVLKDRHDIRSDPRAVRIICPVSFHKAAKDTEKSPSTKTKPLTWILRLSSFLVLFSHHVFLLTPPNCASLCTHTSTYWHLCRCVKFSSVTWVRAAPAPHTAHNTRGFMY